MDPFHFEIEEMLHNETCCKVPFYDCLLAQPYGHPSDGLENALHKSFKEVHFTFVFAPKIQLFSANKVGHVKGMFDVPVRVHCGHH